MNAMPEDVGAAWRNEGLPCVHRVPASACNWAASGPKCRRHWALDEKPHAHGDTHVKRLKFRASAGQMMPQ